MTDLDSEPNPIAVEFVAKFLFYDRMGFGYTEDYAGSREWDECVLEAKEKYKRFEHLPKFLEGNDD